MLSNGCWTKFLVLSPTSYTNPNVVIVSITNRSRSHNHDRGFRHIQIYLRRYFPSTKNNKGKKLAHSSTEINIIKWVQKRPNSFQISVSSAIFNGRESINQRKFSKVQARPRKKVFPGPSKAGIDRSFVPTIPPSRPMTWSGIKSSPP